MLVKELFEHLSSGEFQTMAIGGNNESGIQEKDYKNVIPLINVALGEIHKRFLIKTDYLIIQMLENIGQYYLHPKYAMNNTASTEMFKYIRDTQFKPFNDSDTVIKIEKVFHEDGTEAHLNDDNAVWSIYTPTEKSIQVPFADRDNAYTVEYRANHEKITFDGDVDELLSTEVDINFTYVTPLLYAIAQRYYATKGENGVVLSNTYGNKYELACLGIEQRGLTTTNETTNNKLEMNGWC